MFYIGFNRKDLASSFLYTENKDTSNLDMRAVFNNLKTFSISRRSLGVLNTFKSTNCIGRQIFKILNSIDNLTVLGIYFKLFFFILRSFLHPNFRDFVCSQILGIFFTLLSFYQIFHLHNCLKTFFK